jgi:uncharacterized membrane protein
MRRGDARPVYACAATILCIGVLWRGSNPLLDLAAAIPLLFYLPGWAVLRALDAEPEGWLETAVLRVMLSLAMVVIAGLLLNLAGSITKPGWLAVLGAITLTACLIALITGKRAAAKDSSADGSQTASVFCRPLPLLMIAVSIAIGAASVALVVEFATNHPDFLYTQLWIVPKPDAPDQVIVGLRNAEAADETYAIELLVDHRLVQSWSEVSLKPGETWTTALRWAGLGEYPSVVQRQSATDQEPLGPSVVQRAALSAPRVEALVYRSQNRSVIYRHVWTAPQCFMNGPAHGKPPCES